MKINLLLYRCLLRLYPARHRRDYRLLMEQTFADMCRDAYRRQGRRGLVSLWRVVMWDTLVNAGVEHLGELRRTQRRSLLFFGFALLAAFVVGDLDVHASEVQATLMIMLPLAFLLGLLHPRRAWLWALMIGLSVPVSSWIAIFTGYLIPAKMPAPAYTGLIALIPAFIGVYSGVIAHRILGLRPVDAA